MKKNLLLLSVTLFAVSSFAQNIVTESNGKVTLRTPTDSVVAIVDPIGSGAIDASFNTEKSELVVIYDNGKVAVKKPNGERSIIILQPASDKAIMAVWSGDNIIITTQANQTITKTKADWKH